MNITWLDKAIAFVSPQAGLNRLKARYIQETISTHGPKNKYEGASRGRRTDGWQTQATSANYEVGLGINMLRQRSRDLVRNNPYASRAVSVITSHTVGTGIVPQVKGATDTQNKNLDAIVRDHLLTPAIDADGRNNLFGHGIGDESRPLIALIGFLDDALGLGVRDQFK